MKFNNISKIFEKKKQIVINTLTKFPKEEYKK
jgi:hypothetical protein